MKAPKTKLQNWVLIVSVLCILSCCQDAWACSCGGSRAALPFGQMGLLSTTSAHPHSDSTDIFVGYVIDVDKVTNGNSDGFLDYVRIRFAVEESFKGEASDTLDVYTSDDSASCGYLVSDGTTHLILAYRDSAGIAHTSSCSGNVHRAYESAEFERQVSFLRAITNMIDGDYHFARALNCQPGASGLPRTVVDASFSVRDGRLEGYFRLNDLNGEVLEEGFYEDGKREGPWISRAVFVGDRYEHALISLSVVTYVDGIARQLQTGTQRRELHLATDSLPKLKVVTRVAGMGTNELKRYLRDQPK